MATPPFTVRLLPGTKSETTGQAPDLAAELPASHRNRDDDVVAPKPTDLDFLNRELRVDKIDSVLDWLWICGLPKPPRPLHHQLVIQRDIIITENPELHLVWSKSRMFLKPLPTWLLDPDFWKAYILEDPQKPNDTQARRELTKCARGFLFSYCALIGHESDFRIAQDKRLLSSEIKWADWRNFTKEVLDSHCFEAVNPRYWYGELRLSRLNKIYIFRKGDILRGYSTVGGHAVFNDLMQDNFALLAGVLGYVVIVLTAMQVGLATEQLQQNDTFQDVSYGFTVFSIIAPLAGAAGILMSVVLLLIAYCYGTLKYRPKRFRAMGVEADWKKKDRHGKVPPKSSTNQVHVADD